MAIMATFLIRRSTSGVGRRWGGERRGRSRARPSNSCRTADAPLSLRCASSGTRGYRRLRHITSVGEAGTTRPTSTTTMTTLGTRRDDAPQRGAGGVTPTRGITTQDRRRTTVTRDASTASDPARRARGRRDVRQGTRRRGTAARGRSGCRRRAAAITFHPRAGTSTMPTAGLVGTIARRPHSSAARRRTPPLRPHLILPSPCRRLRLRRLQRPRRRQASRR
jgi:hypothetical protein